jgi:hypothetical protein
MVVGFVLNSSKKELLMELQQWFQHHGKLLPKERNYLNDWNE